MLWHAHTFIHHVVCLISGPHHTGIKDFLMANHSIQVMALDLIKSWLDYMLIPILGFTIPHNALGAKST